MTNPAVVVASDTPDRFQLLMDAWAGTPGSNPNDGVLGRVHPDLRVYRWQPRGVPQAPCVWNWLLPSQATPMDVRRLRDTINLSTTVAIEHTDEDVENARLERYVDAYRDVVDPLLWTPRRQLTLQGTAWRAQRTTMQTAPVQVGGVQLLAVVFNMQFDVDRAMVA